MWRKVMFKDIITNKNNKNIYLEYDKNEYDIQYEKMKIVSF